MVKQQPIAAGGPPGRSGRLLRPLAWVLVGLLASQFLLGMVTNLYARLPAAVPGLHGSLDNRLGTAARWALLHGPLVLKIHVIVGLAIGGCAITLAVLAFPARQPRWRPCALLGLLMAAPAGLAGAAFLAYRQDNVYSLLMAAGFLGALFAYWTGLFLTREPVAPRNSRLPSVMRRPRLRQRDRRLGALGSRARLVDHSAQIICFCAGADAARDLNHQADCCWLYGSLGAGVVAGQRWRGRR